MLLLQKRQNHVFLLSGHVLMKLSVLPRKKLREMTRFTPDFLRSIECLRFLRLQSFKIDCECVTSCNIRNYWNSKAD